MCVIALTLIVSWRPARPVSPRSYGELRDNLITLTILNTIARVMSLSRGTCMGDTGGERRRSGAGNAPVTLVTWCVMTSNLPALLSSHQGREVRRRKCPGHTGPHDVLWLLISPHCSPPIKTETDRIPRQLPPPELGIYISSITSHQMSTHFNIIASFGEIYYALWSHYLKNLYIVRT